jgi:Carboxypeptidase regulatory-like domain
VDYLLQSEVVGHRSVSPTFILGHGKLVPGRTFLKRSMKIHFWRAVGFRLSSFQTPPPIAIRAIVCGAIVLGFCAAARGQLATGQFNGHVFPQNGAVVPGATVTLEDVPTSFSRSTETNGEGLYKFPLLPPGTYKRHLKRLDLRFRHFNKERVSSSDSFELSLYPLALTGRR